MEDDASSNEDNSRVFVLCAYHVWISMSRNYRIWTSIPLFTPSSKDQPRVIVKMVLIYMWSRFRSIQSQQDVFFGLKAKRLQSAPERAKVSIWMELLSPKGDLETWGLWICIAREHARLLGFCCVKPFAFATKIFWSLEVTPTNEFGMNQIGLKLAGVCTARI